MGCHGPSYIPYDGCIYPALWTPCWRLPGWSLRSQMAYLSCRTNSAEHARSMYDCWMYRYPDRSYLCRGQPTRHRPRSEIDVYSPKAWAKSADDIKYLKTLEIIVSSDIMHRAFISSNARLGFRGRSAILEDWWKTARRGRPTVPVVRWYGIRSAH